MGAGMLLREREKELSFIRLLVIVKGFGRLGGDSY